MQAHMEKRARDLVDMLKRGGTNCGLIVVNGTVVARCMGAPYTDAPTPYDETDLDNAIELNLLEKRKVTGTLEWGWYCAR